MKPAHVNNETTITEQEIAMLRYFAIILFDKVLSLPKNIEYKNIIDNLLPIKNNLQNNKDYLKCKEYIFAPNNYITADMFNSFIAILNNPTEENVISFCKICQ